MAAQTTIMQFSVPQNFFQRSDGQGVCYSSHSPSNPYSSLPLSPSPPNPPSFWPEPEVHLFLSAAARLVRSSCCCSLASGKWRLLQTHKLPIWRGINSKGHYEPFLTQSANAEVNKVGGLCTVHYEGNVYIFIYIYI